MGLVYSYIIKYFKYPLIILLPYVSFIFLQEIVFRFFDYNFLNENQHYSLVLNYNENLLIKYLEVISSEFYSTIESVVPSGVANQISELSSSMSKNFLFNIGLFYAVYTSFAFFIFPILINNKFIYNLLSKKGFNQDDKNRVNDANGDFYRDLRHSDIRVTLLNIELKLLVTNVYTMKIAQFSLFLGFSLTFVPYLMHEYVFFISKYASLPFIVFGLNTYVFFFIQSMIFELVGLSILAAVGLTLIFFKNNLIVSICKKFIVRNFILLNNIEIEKTGDNRNTMERLKEFESEKLEALFLQEIKSK